MKLPEFDDKRTSELDVSNEVIRKSPLGGEDFVCKAKTVSKGRKVINDLSDEEELVDSNFQGDNLSDDSQENDINSDHISDERQLSRHKPSYKKRVIALESDSDEAEEKTFSLNPESNVTNNPPKSPPENEKNPSYMSMDSNSYHLSDERQLSRHKPSHKKIFKDLESDSDEDEGKTFSPNPETNVTNNLPKSPPQTENTPSYMSMDINSDHISDERQLSKNNPSYKKKVKALESDSDEDEENTFSLNPETNVTNNPPKSPPETVKNPSYMSMFQNSDLYDAEGSSDEEINPKTPQVEECYLGKKDEPQMKPVKKKIAPPRKSKLTALEEIHSETQRIVRHSRVVLPYHQPKQHSLSEFLSRNKVPIIPLKTNSQELSKFWMCIEEREKSAESFYKSESDNSEDECKKSKNQLKNGKTSSSEKDTAKTKLCIPSETISSNQQDTNSRFSGVPVINSSSIHSIANSEESLKTLTTESSLINLTTENDSLESSESDSLKLQLTENTIFDISTLEKTTSKSLTEEDNSMEVDCNDSEEIVPTSAKEDCNNTDTISVEQKEIGNTEIALQNDLNITPSIEPLMKYVLDDSERFDSKKKIHSLLQHSLSDIKLDRQPQISGSSDSFIDLNEGSEKPGALQLVSRFMKHAKLKPRVKKQEQKLSISIAEVNAKGEVIGLNEEIINIKVGEHSKPGETRVQLKAKLQEKIAKRREKEFVKRVEEYKLSEEFFEDETKDEVSDIEEDFHILESSSTESEPEENDMDISDRIEKCNNPFLDEEAEESDDEDNEEIDEGGGNDARDSSEEENSRDSHSAPLSANIAPLLQNRIGLSNASEQNTPILGGGSGFAGLCSGGFPTEGFNMEDLEKNDFSKGQKKILNESGQNTPMLERRRENSPSPNAAVDPGPGPSRPRVHTPNPSTSDSTDPVSRFFTTGAAIDIESLNEDELMSLANAIGRTSKAFSDEEETSGSEDEVDGAEGQTQDVGRGSGFSSLCSGGFPTADFNLEDLEKNDKTNCEGQNKDMTSGSSEYKGVEVLINEKKTEIDMDNDSSDEEIFVKKPKINVKLAYSDDEEDDPPNDLENSEDSQESKTVNEELIDDEIDDNDDDISDVDDIIDDNDEDENLEDDKKIEELDEDEDEEAFLKKPAVAAKQFFEDEAELSGSEYGSGDEDEVDLDKYEEEEGDKDVLNKRKIKRDLEKYYRRDLLKDDDRELLVLKEILLKDGDLHSDGPKRQRQFKWYNLDENQIPDQGTAFDDDYDGRIDRPDEEEDESWRKARLEREKFLSIFQEADDVHPNKLDLDEIELQNRIVKPSPKVPTPKTDTTTFKSPNLRKQFTLITKRGSFLNRGEKVLSKIAEITNVTSDNPLTNTRGNRNMVFSVVSPPKEKEPTEQTPKRKNTDQAPTAAKRLRFAPINLNKNRTSVFEKLKMSEKM